MGCLPDHDVRSTLALQTGTSMKHWFWHRFVILFLAIVLPLSAVSASLAAPCPMQGHAVMLDASDAKMPLQAAEEPLCSAPCDREQQGSCPDMAHSCASCMAYAMPSATNLALPVTLTSDRPAVLDPPSFIPPLLERPPAHVNSLA